MFLSRSHKNHSVRLPCPASTTSRLQLHRAVKLSKFNCLTFLFLFLYRLLQDNELTLHRQSSVCETDLATLKLRQEACQFGHFLQANQWKNGLPALFLILLQRLVTLVNWKSSMNLPVKTKEMNNLSSLRTL